MPDNQEQANCKVAAQQSPYSVPWYGSGLGAGSDLYAEKQRYQTQQYVLVLREARRIRQDPEAMALIRDYIRQERDNLAELLDEGGIE
jgi:hypothetical protein